MDLAPYFKKSGELDAFITRLVDVGRAKIIGSSLSDDKLIKFYGFLGNELVGEILNRIMAKEGIQDTARRGLWMKKSCLHSMIVSHGRKTPSMMPAIVWMHSPRAWWQTLEWVWCMNSLDHS